MTLSHSLTLSLLFTLSLHDISLINAIPQPSRRQNTATCKDDDQYDWIYHPAGQSPCDLYALGAANCGMPALQPLDEFGTSVYPALSDTNAAWCICSLEIYNLMAACSYCQGYDWLTLNDWTSGCFAFNDYTLDPITEPLWIEQVMDESGKWNAENARTTAIRSGANSTDVVPTEEDGFPNTSQNTTDTNTEDTTKPTKEQEEYESKMMKIIIGIVVPLVVALIGLLGALYIARRNRAYAAQYMGIPNRRY